MCVLGATTREPHEDLDSSFSPTPDLRPTIFPFKVTHDREAPHQQGGQENRASPSTPAQEAPHVEMRQEGAQHPVLHAHIWRKP